MATYGWTHENRRRPERSELLDDRSLARQASLQNDRILLISSTAPRSIVRVDRTSHGRVGPAGIFQPPIESGLMWNVFRRTAADVGAAYIRMQKSKRRVMNRKCLMAVGTLIL